MSQQRWSLFNNIPKLSRNSIKMVLKALVMRLRHYEKCFGRFGIQKQDRRYEDVGFNKYYHLPDLTSLTRF